MTAKSLTRRALLLTVVVPSALRGQVTRPATQPGQPATAFSVPRWAFPSLSPDAAMMSPPMDTLARLRVPGSSRTFVAAQIRNLLNPADWFPDSHRQAPDVVLHSRPAAAYACGFCHLPDGQGRSENATIVGLPVEYFIRQLGDLRSGARRGALPDWGPVAKMRGIAMATTQQEAVDAARYFGRMRARRRYTVAERTTIPATFEANGLYAARPGTDSEPLAGRLIEISNDIARHELHDPNETFTAFVPPGSIARGRHIAIDAPPPAATRCATCHGMNLRGVGLVPPIAGRSPAYLLRQLLAFRSGGRSTAAGAPMQLVAAQLALPDMIAVAAYAGSRNP